MNKEIYDLYLKMGLSEKVLKMAEEAENGLKERFKQIDAIAEYNQLKILHAMQKNRVSEAHLGTSTGYGYNDIGRDTLEQVYADVFHTEAALVRPQITCGTHALTVALAGNLRPGDEIFSPVGLPYDTLQGVIGIREEKGCLKEYGITYNGVDLKKDGSFDYDAIREGINEKTRLVTIQRSKGYADRPTLSVERIGELIKFIKDIKPDIICMVDNCYGEFIETIEPSDVGADMVVGSLIKIRAVDLHRSEVTYAVKKSMWIMRHSDLLRRDLEVNWERLLVLIPRFIRDFSCTYGISRCIKGCDFAARLYEKLGYRVIPNGTEERYDIIQAVELETPEKLIAFCKGIQAAAPVDSHVTPEPWDMPGYDSKVIMAAGAFISGSSIELSADGPLRPPYTVFFQGGLTWYHAKFGIMMSLQKLLELE